MPVAVLMKIELPFICDDIFDDSLVPYPNTGYNFKSLELDVDVNDYEELEVLNEEDVDNELEIIFIFSIVLVSKEKKAVINKSTPKKKAVRDKKYARKSQTAEV